MNFFVSILRSWFPWLFPGKTVGWLCSVTQAETKDFLDAFKTGLNDTTVQFNPKYANGDYEAANINTLTNDAIQLMNAGVHVIVAISVGRQPE
jgi:hypothetical protein